MNMKHFKSASFALSASFATLLACPSAQALDQIIRPLQSIRAGGMGGVRLTTGLYDENFFNNPARVTANPKFRFSILDVMAEGNSNLPSTISNITGSGDLLTKIGSGAGSNNHVRVQTTFPGIYIPTGDDGKWAFAFAIISSTQADIDLRQSFSVSPQAISDIGPAFTVGRKLLDDNALSVGATSHLTYRLASDQNYTFVDLIRGRSLSPLQTGGQGTGLDFDLGATYRLPLLTDSPFKFNVAASIGNLLGGTYANIGFRPIASMVLLPPAQPRTYGFGGSATRESWWKLTDTTFALEFTDIGNNPDGGFFRLVHLGAETHLSVFAFRAGVNQGYLTAGMGIDLRFVTLELATYGEEMSLNPGGLEDRRYALKLAFQIQ
jgi:hypothetical protein